jgi:hypothetical protein
MKFECIATEDITKGMRCLYDPKQGTIEAARVNESLNK